MANSGWQGSRPSQWARKVSKDQQTRMRRASLIGLRGVVLRTPVGNPAIWQTPYPPKGYVGGRARANWQLTIGSPASGELDIVDESGTAALAQQATIGPFDVVFLTNNVPYAERLENGWSTQAPNGMVAVTLVEIKERLG